MKTFKIGDILKGNNTDMYAVTNDESIVEVIGYCHGGVDDIKVKVLEKKSNPKFIGYEFYVESRYFDLITDLKEETKADKVEDVKSIKIVEENGVTFIIVNEKTTLAVPCKMEDIGKSVKHKEDDFCEEIGKAIAFYRLLDKYNNR